ncbi:MAG: ABC transporter substrate-binding protein [Hydrogeniiclostridium sp.]
MKRRILAMLLSAVVCLTMFGGCTQGNTSSQGAESGSSAQSSNASQGEASSAEKTDTITVVDHGGNTVEVPKEIDRVAVVGILPFPSVIAMYLGSAEKLVGIPPASKSAAEIGLLGEIFPEILNAETGYTNGSDLNIEELMNLDPDVVFYLAGNDEWKTAMESAGIPCIGVSTSKWDYDVLETYDQWIDLLSQVFPEENKSQEVSDYSKEMYDMIQERVGSLSDEEKKEILFLYQYDDSQIVTSGKHFFGQFWAEAVGGKNAAEEVQADNSNAVINMEQVYTWDPDVVFITNFTAAMPDDLYNNELGNDWSSVKAVKDKAVYKMPLGSYRSFTPGTDTPVTLLWLAQKTYPELFDDIDLTQEVKEYYKDIYGVELTDEQVDRMYNPEAHAAEGTQK